MEFERALPATQDAQDAGDATQDAQGAGDPEDATQDAQDAGDATQDAQGAGDATTEASAGVAPSQRWCERGVFAFPFELRILR